MSACHPKKERILRRETATHTVSELDRRVEIEAVYFLP